ncbi:ASCH domain-containing protein [Pacificoceanicola onchidii]|uniref:ASCH domain-containing protein n=1 Tax=Pacificoceanicola onchidii TaxID=2562685 RepID=UPI0010A3B4E3|nr:ASCH domain-containing protein [Pacificoceanicola onchidii]
MTQKKTLQQLVDENPQAETFRFGDSKTLCDEILALVRSGQKTATVEAMRAFEKEGDALPEVGRRDIALTWEGAPAAMIETVAVEVMRFDEMTEEKVAAQGEFRDLAHWQKGYRAYFSRNGGVSDDMRILYETFRVVEDYA